MKTALIISLFLVGCASAPTDEVTDAPEATIAKSASPFTADAVYEKLLPLADKSLHKQARPQNSTEFSLMLPSEKPHVDEKGEWIDSTVRVYYRDQQTVNQITLVTQNCNVKFADLDQAAMSKRMQVSVELISKTLFETPFTLSDKYFIALGPQWDVPVRVPIKEEYAPVMDMRLSRGGTKCNTRGGYSYRYDFFMK